MATLAESTASQSCEGEVVELLEPWRTRGMVECVQVSGTSAAAMPCGSVLCRGTGRCTPGRKVRSGAVAVGRGGSWRPWMSKPSLATQGRRGGFR